MRIAVVNHTRRRVGGAESYLARIMPGLAAASHEVMFWCESDTPDDRDPIACGPGMTACVVSGEGPDAALRALREWKPDVQYVHGLVDPGLEARVLDVAPSVFFAHGYYGTCISGHKMVRFPDTRPCSRAFGPGCLVRFYPQRCGGLNPVTMAIEYRRQAQRLRLLERYAAILTHTRHMQQEYARYPALAGKVLGSGYTTGLASIAATDPPSHRKAADRALSVLFAGRMSDLKGGSVLLEALPAVARSLSRPLIVTFIGDGPSRAAWQRQAAHIERTTSSVRIEFTGWLGRQAIEDRLHDCDVHVMPSLWPEPYGLAGIEAARIGVPTVAFAVGGITDWLTPGVNGETAPADPPTAKGLAEAILRCVQDPARLAVLRAGASHMAAERDDPTVHLRFLEQVLTRAASTRSRD